MIKMNTKITMILTIITIGMSFGCIGHTSEVTIQEPISTEIELAEIEYHENSTSNPFVEPTFDALSESITESTTEASPEPTTTPIIITVQTPTSTPIPEQILDRQAIIDRINYLQECPETQELYEKQEEYNILIRAIEHTIEENGKLGDPIESIEWCIASKQETIEYYEQQLENIPALIEEIEELKVEVQLYIEERAIEEEKLRNDSLSDEERTEICNNIEILADKIYLTNDIILNKEIRVDDKDSTIANIEFAKSQIEDYQDDIREIEKLLFTLEEMEKLEAEMDVLFAERNIYVDKVHEITEEIIELQALLAEMQ